MNVKKKVPATPRTYKDVKSLTYDTLLRLCKDANVETRKVGRDALEIFLCDALGISTTGTHTGQNQIRPRLDNHCLDDNELKEFIKLTPAYVQGLPGWTKDIRNVPDVDIGGVKRYLLSSNNPDFTKDTLKKYKQTRAYGHVSAKHINGLLFNPLPNSDTFCIVKAQCIPSQSGDSRHVKWLHVILDKHLGEPYGAFCICAAGKGQACAHVGALLFILTELVASGEEELPEDLSCTDVLCQWSETKNASVNPKILEDVTIREGTPVSKPSVSQYAPQVAPRLSPEEDYQRVLKFLFDIRNSNSKSTMPPVVNIVDVNRFRTRPIPAVPSQTVLPDECEEFDLPYSFECDVTTYPLPITKRCSGLFSSVQDAGYEEEKNRFISSLELNVNDRLKIEEITKGQSENSEWYEQRKGCITGSKINRIVSFFKNGKANQDTIVGDVMLYDLNKDLSKSVPALAWGTKHESKALNMFVKVMKKTHRDVELIRPGLLVHPESPFIRVSPDGVVTCACHGSMLVEVKCPISHKNDNLQVLAMKGKLSYIENKEGQLHVKKGDSRGYYEQITLQQVLSGEKEAVLLVWGKKGYITVSMKFDQTYWEYIYPLLKTFFEDYIVPEILTGRIKSERSRKCLTAPVQAVCETQSDSTSQSTSRDDDDDSGSRSDTTSQLTSSNDYNDDDDDDSNSEHQVERGYASNSHESQDSEKTANDLHLNVSSVSVSEGASSGPVLGCKNLCKDHRAPNFSKVKGQIIMCDSNLICAPNTGYHYFCEGFRRLPKERDYLPYYACSKCRASHPQKENIYVTNGFYQ